MQKIPLSMARPGMVLAEPVLRPNGLVLVGEGAELTEAMIERLRCIDIDAVTVEGNPLDGGDFSGSVFATRLERLDHLFRKHAGDEWMGKVKGVFRNYFLLKAAEESARQTAAAEACRETGGEGA